MTNLIFSKCLAMLCIIAVLGCMKTVETNTNSVYTGTDSVRQGAQQPPLEICSYWGLERRD